MIPTKGITMLKLERDRSLKY